MLILGLKRVNVSLLNLVFNTFMTLWSNFFVHFLSITFNLGKFANFKALFPADSMDIH